MIHDTFNFKFCRIIKIIDCSFSYKVPPPSNLNPKPLGEDVTVNPANVWEKEIHKYYKNDSGTYEMTYINRTRKINIGGMLIEYEGEDSGIGLLFASKAMIQIFVNPISGTVIDRIGTYQTTFIDFISILIFSMKAFAKNYVYLIFL